MRSKSVSELRTVKCTALIFLGPARLLSHKKIFCNIFGNGGGTVIITRPILLLFFRQGSVRRSLHFLNLRCYWHSSYEMISSLEIVSICYTFWRLHYCTYIWPCRLFPNTVITLTVLHSVSFYRPEVTYFCLLIYFCLPFRNIKHSDPHRHYVLTIHHSLVFSLRGRVGRNQSPVMWTVWLWHTASWASSWG